MGIHRRPFEEALEEVHNLGIIHGHNELDKLMSGEAGVRRKESIEWFESGLQQRGEEAYD